MNKQAIQTTIEVLLTKWLRGAEKLMMSEGGLEMQLEARAEATNALYDLHLKAEEELAKKIGALADELADKYFDQNPHDERDGQWAAIPGNIVYERLNSLVTEIKAKRESHGA